MSRGGKFLIATAVFAVAGCSMDQGKLEVRATPSALTRGAQPVPQRIAEARGQLAIGNVALALEAFRKASRDDPNSTDALAGMADCYDRMGRFDLSRRYYETALALAPADPQLLGAFAASLQHQGLNAEALNVRQEIAARSAAPAATTPKPAFVLRAPSGSPAPSVASFEDAKPGAALLPQDLFASTFAMAPPTLVPREFGAQQVNVAELAVPAKIPVSLPPISAAEIVSVPQVDAAPAGPSVSIKLPAPRVVEAAKRVDTKAAAPAAPTRTAAVEATSLQPFVRPSSEPSFAKSAGPRLERLSMGEIRLVTTSAPMWQSTMVAQNSRSTTVRFIPLRQASFQWVRVRLLNAARVDRLAARTRNWLIARGWRGMAIGNAPATRRQSVVLYPADKRYVAQKLASQFGFALAPSSSSRHVTVLLGSDAARHPALRRNRG